MPCLEALYLWKNQIRDTPNAFSGLSKLRMLSLSGNRLTKVDDCFQGLAGLETLGLSENLIQEIHSEAFSGLGSLRVVMVSGNNLKSVDKRCFAQLKSVVFAVGLFNNVTRFRSFLASSEESDMSIFRLYYYHEIKSYTTTDNWEEFINQF